MDNSSIIDITPDKTAPLTRRRQSLNLLPSEGPLYVSPLTANCDGRAAENMIPCLNVFVSNAAEEAVQHKPTF